MTEPTPGFEPPANPKAAAKAAKAYAKASRKWYQKKRWWAIGAIIVIIAIAAASGGSSDSGPKKVDDASTSAGQTSGGDSSKSASGKDGSADNGGDTAGTKENPIKVGETVELAGTRYTVKKAVTAQNIGGEFGEKADGTYVNVTLTIENMKDETKTFMSSAAQLVTTDGNAYDTTDDDIYADKPLILEDMQPELPKTGTLLFDVPPAKVAGALLKVSDLFGDGDAYVDLGLK